MTEGKINKKVAVGCISYFCKFGIVLPIWYYLNYRILQRVEASDLMWFLFWVYVPVSIFLEAFLTTMGKMLFSDDQQPGKRDGGLVHPEMAEYIKRMKENKS